MENESNDYDVRLVWRLSECMFMQEIIREYSENSQKHRFHVCRER